MKMLGKRTDVSIKTKTPSLKQAKRRLASASIGYIQSTASGLCV